MKTKLERQIEYCDHIEELYRQDPVAHVKGGWPDTSTIEWQKDRNALLRAQWAIEAAFDAGEDVAIKFMEKYRCTK